MRSSEPVFLSLVLPYKTTLKLNLRCVYRTLMPNLVLSLHSALYSHVFLIYPTHQQYLSLNPLPHILSILTSPSKSSTTSGETRSKAIYCLSNTLKHNAPAVKTFDSLGGWSAVKNALQGACLPQFVIVVIDYSTLSLYCRLGYQSSAKDGVLVEYSPTTRRSIV